MADCVMTNNVRREIRSAIQPPNRENARVGTPAIKPDQAQIVWGSSDLVDQIPLGGSCIQVPIKETIWPMNHSR